MVGYRGKDQYGVKHCVNCGIRPPGAPGWVNDINFPFFPPQPAPLRQAGVPPLAIGPAAAAVFQPNTRAAQLTRQALAGWPEPEEAAQVYRPDQHKNLPKFLKAIDAEDPEIEDLRSSLLVDTRDGRICCPIQRNLPTEVRQIAYSGLQRNSSERMVPKAEDGYETTLYYSFSDNKNKHTLFLTFSSPTSVPPASWDASLRTLTHAISSFKSFYWPIALSDTSPVITHATVTYDGEALIQFVFKALRSQEDMHVSRNEIMDFTWDMFVKDPQGTEKLGITIAVYAGWRVSLVAFDVRSRVLAASAHGRAFFLDEPSVHTEFRSVPVSSSAAVGFDPPEIDFRFEDRAAKISCRASTVMAPPELLIIQNVRNLTELVNTARAQGARVICPDPVLQPPQLMTLYDSWLSLGEAQERFVETVEIDTSAVPGGNISEQPLGTHLVVDAPQKRYPIQQVTTTTGALSPPVRLDLNNQSGQLMVLDKATGEEVESEIYIRVLANEAFKSRHATAQMLSLGEGTPVATQPAIAATAQTASSSSNAPLQVAQEAELPVPSRPPQAFVVADLIIE